MGTSTATLYPTWPTAGSQAFVTRGMDFKAFREAEIPLSKSATAYVKQDPAGSTSGGGGIGVELDPYLVRNYSDLIALVASVAPAGDTLFYIHEDAVLRHTSGLTTPQASFAMASYGPSGGKAVVSGFSVDDGTGWTSANGMHGKTYASAVHWVRLNQHPSIALALGNETVFRRTGCNITAISVHASAPTITTGTVDGSGHITAGSYHGLKVGDTVVIPRSNSTPALSGVYTVASVPSTTTFTVSATTTVAGTSGFVMQRTDNCFAYDAVTTTLYARVGANVSPGTQIIEVCQSSGDAILVNHNACRIEDLIILGWGMESVASQRYCARFTLAGTNAFLAKNCDFYYTGHHQAGHLVSSPGSAGGISTWIGCKLGLARVDSFGEGTLLVSYNYDGGNDVMYWECDALYGGLPDTCQASKASGVFNNDYPRTCVLGYAHGNGSVEIGSALAWGCRSRDHTYGCKQNMSFGNTKAYTHNRGNTDEYRAWIVNEQFDGGNGTLINLTYVNTVVLWCRFRAKLPVGVTSVFNAGGSADQVKSTMIGVNVEIDYTNIVASGGNKPWHANTVDQYLDGLFCTFRSINCPADYYAWDARAVSSPYKVAYNRFFNCVFSTGIGALRPSYHNCPNSAPTTGASTAADASLTGGAVNCAYFKTGTSGNATMFGPANFSADYLGHDSQTGVIELSAEPGRTDVPATGGSLYQAANTSLLPNPVEWYFDQNGVLRRMPSRPSVGAVQAADNPPLFAGGGTAGLTTKLLLLGAA